MTMTTEHDHTEQEQAIWDALEAGDHEAIETMRTAALVADRSDAETKPAGEGPASEQFDTDYLNAYAHYQDAHEAPEQEREQAAAERAEIENDYAELASE